MTVDLPEHSPESIQALREDILREFQSIETVLEVETQWHMLRDQERSWPEEATQVFLSSHLQTVQLPGSDAGAAVRIHLVGDVEDLAKARDAAARVCALWAAEGWKVHQLGPNYYRADRQNGATMTIEARERDQHGLLSLALQSMPMAPRAED